MKRPPLFKTSMANSLACVGSDRLSRVKGSAATAACLNAVGQHLPAPATFWKHVALATCKYPFLANNTFSPFFP